MSNDKIDKKQAKEYLKALEKGEKELEHIPAEYINKDMVKLCYKRAQKEKNLKPLKDILLYASCEFITKDIVKLYLELAGDDAEALILFLKRVPKDLITDKMIEHICMIAKEKKDSVLAWNLLKLAAGGHLKPLLEDIADICNSDPEGTLKWDIILLDGIYKDKLAVTGYKGTDKTLKIPPLIFGDPVVKIGRIRPIAEGLTEITLPDTVLIIEDRAFAGCKLENLIIPDSVTEIGESAFKDNKIARLSLGNSVTKIGDSAFENNCLTELDIPEGVKRIEKSVFKGNKIASLTLHNGIVFIGDRAFEENSLTELVIPDSVTGTGGDAFRGNKIAKLTIGKGIQHINLRAFADNCLTELAIPETVRSIGGKAFMGNRIESLTIPGTVNTVNVEAFKDNRLTSLTICEGVKTLDHRIFENNKLTEVTIPGSVIAANLPNMAKDEFKGNEGIVLKNKDGEAFDSKDPNASTFKKKSFPFKVQPAVDYDPRKTKSASQSAARFCTNCGSPLTSGANFCTKCGAKI